VAILDAWILYCMDGSELVDVIETPELQEIPCGVLLPCPALSGFCGVKRSPSSRFSLSPLSRETGEEDI
jgi:hypothetical protein